MWGSAARRGDWEPNRNKKNERYWVLATNVYFKLFQILCHNLLPFQLCLSSYHPKFQDNNFSRTFCGIPFILHFLEEPLFFQITPFSPCQISISYGDRKKTQRNTWVVKNIKQAALTCLLCHLGPRKEEKTDCHGNKVPRSWRRSLWWARWEWVHNRTEQRIFWWAWTCAILHCGISLWGHVSPSFPPCESRISFPGKLAWSVDFYCLSD